MRRHNLPQKADPYDPHRCPTIRAADFPSTIDHALLPPDVSAIGATGDPAYWPQGAGGRSTLAESRRNYTVARTTAGWRHAQTTPGRLLFFKIREGILSQYRSKSTCFVTPLRRNGPRLRTAAERADAQ